MVTRRTSCLATVLLASAIVATEWQPAQGAVTWVSANPIDSWHVAGNWSPAAVPVAGDTVWINNGKTAQITADATALYVDIFSGRVIQDGGNATQTLTFCGLGAGSGTYVLNGGNLTTWLTVGQTTGMGSDFTVNGGAMTTTHLWLGNNATGDATFHMNGGSLTVNGDFQIANHGTSDVNATFTQTGGTVSVDSAVTMTLGEYADTNGWAKYELLGGTLTLNRAGTPLAFAADPAPIYIDFEYGSPTWAALNLKGVWDYASLTGIANSDFRVRGDAARPDTLRFVAGSGALNGYTIVYGVAPEPSVAVLLVSGIAMVVLLKRRRKAA